MNKDFIYLDHAASTPVYPEVVEAMLPWLTENHANASGNHMAGWLAADAVDKSRKIIAALIGAEPHEIFFTCGATESINWALKGWFERFGESSVLFTQPTEHSAVLSTASWLESRGGAVSRMPLGPNPDFLMRALEPIDESNALLAIASANNETGILQPLKEIGKIAAKKKWWFFCDATQSIGKEKINVRELNCDLLAFSGHKMGGPKGIGVLFVSERAHESGFKPLIHGGTQQQGLRAGTLNVPAIVGLAKACELVSKFDAEKVHALRNQLEQKLEATFNARVIGKSVDRAPHISSVMFPGINVQNLMDKIAHQLAVSSGAACNSAKVEPSHVLKAMGVSDEEAYSTLRFSLGWSTSVKDIEDALTIVANVLRS